ncbi:MAG: glycosyl transferase [Acidobacteria bacterium]|nr:MAG: glycosyl transferase [Acidobacteriota bacterium]
MNLDNGLTIVIPAKNEALLIPRLLEALSQQDYPQIGNTRVLVADSGSTDGTAEVVNSFRDRLQVEVIPGGIPSEGRNAGAARATTKYVLFIDADVQPADKSLIRRALETAQQKNLQCVTTNIICCNGSWLDKAFYIGNNFFQYLSCLHKPFSTGMFMLFEKSRFDALGGFNPKILFAEDYYLSKQLKRGRFAIVPGGVFTTNRRFQKMGHARVARLFFWTAFNFWNPRFFLRDHKYWAQ